MDQLSGQVSKDCSSSTSVYYLTQEPVSTLPAVQESSLEEKPIKTPDQASVLTPTESITQDDVMTQELLREENDMEEEMESMRSVLGTDYSTDDELNCSEDEQDLDFMEETQRSRVTENSSLLDQDDELQDIDFQEPLQSMVDDESISSWEEERRARKLLLGSDDTSDSYKDDATPMTQPNLMLDGYALQSSSEESLMEVEEQIEEEEIEEVDSQNDDGYNHRLRRLQSLAPQAGLPNVMDVKRVMNLSENREAFVQEIQTVCFEIGIVGNASAADFEWDQDALDLLQYATESYERGLDKPSNQE